MECDFLGKEKKIERYGGRWSEQVTLFLLRKKQISTLRRRTVAKCQQRPLVTSLRMIRNA